MTRVFSTILILALLFSQSVFLIPHSHADSVVGVPGHHGARPHFHLPGSGHHHHGSHHSHDAPATPPVSPDWPLSDHDSDAVYAGELHLLKDTTSLELDDPAWFVSCLPAQTAKTVSAGLASTDEPLTAASRSLCALFLQTQSIRC